jgi:hypothetical protein
VVTISAQSEHFSVLVLTVIVNFGFLNLFLDIWIRNPDPEYGSGSQIQAQIECGSNRIRIRNTGFKEPESSYPSFYLEIRLKTQLGIVNSEVECKLFAAFSITSVLR